MPEPTTITAANLRDDLRAAQDRIEQLEAENTELDRKLKICGYEWADVHKRLSVIRAKKEELVELIDRATMAEALEQMDKLNTG